MKTLGTILEIDDSEIQTKCLMCFVKIAHLYYSCIPDFIEQFCFQFFFFVIFFFCHFFFCIFCIFFVIWNEFFFFLFLFFDFFAFIILF